jgi:hypothetical protein
MKIRLGEGYMLLGKPTLMERSIAREHKGTRDKIQQRREPRPVNLANGERPLNEFK